MLDDSDVLSALGGKITLQEYARRKNYFNPKFKFLSCSLCISIQTHWNICIL